MSSIVLENIYTIVSKGKQNKDENTNKKLSRENPRPNSHVLAFGYCALKTKQRCKHKQKQSKQKTDTKIYSKQPPNL